MIQIISARIDDAKLFYDARFNPLAIKFSRTKTIPMYSEHLFWFEKNYQNGFYTILYNKNPVGYIRINSDNTNTISIAILPMYHNNGIATASLKEIIKTHSNLNAEIYSDNSISLRLFKKFPEIKLSILDTSM